MDLFRTPFGDVDSILGLLKTEAQQICRLMSECPKNEWLLDWLQITALGPKKRLYPPPVCPP